MSEVRQRPLRVVRLVNSTRECEVRDPGGHRGELYQVELDSASLDGNPLEVPMCRYHVRTLRNTLGEV